MASADLQAKLSALTPEQREKLRSMLAAKREGAAAASAPAALPQSAQAAASPADDAQIPRVPDADDYALSFAQKRLWLQEQLIEGKTAAYNVSLAVRLRGALRPEALECALRATMQRHPVLRTRFRAGEREPRQAIMAAPEWALERWADEGEAAFRARAEALANRPFALDRELPVRAAWMPLGSESAGLALVFHHLACDGSSVPILLADLQRFYLAAERGQSLAAEEGATRYVDYAAWHRAWLEGEGGQRAKAYWLRQFAELPERLELPADFPRPAVQDFSGRHLHLSLGRDVADRLMQVGQRAGASLFMSLHAAVAAFLYRYTGQRDIVIGVPVEGRFHPALEGVVGFFVNTLALRTRLSAHEPFAALLRRVQATVLDGFEHQGCPFDVLVGALPLERDLSRPPLFNVMMGLNRAEDEILRLGEVTGEALPLTLTSSKVDLTFHFVDKADGLELDLEYATALFSEFRVRRLAGYFKTLLEALAAAPDVALGDLGLMQARELRARVASFNPPLRLYPRDRSLADLFREQVRRRPEAPAVAFAGRTHSYAEIDRLSERIADHITASLGTLKPEEPIALQVERSERMIAALLGILKAGGCYLPINPGTPTERVKTLLTQASVRLRLVDDEAPLAGWAGADADLRRWCATTPPRTAARPSGGGSQLAYIIFTSGSTGEPKGTLVEQRSVTRLVRDTDYLQLGPEDRVLQTGSLAFDASTFEIWGPLLNGGCCCLPRGKEILEIEQFGELLRSTGATTCFLTTGLFNQIADFHPEAFATLRHLLTGGEKVSVAHVNRVRAAAPSLNVLHVYGPTENTTFSSWYPVREQAAHDVPIGRAIAHSTLYILDERGNLQPPGVAGEIYCGGEGIARGYLGRPELTAERFVPDPFSPTPGAALYRTGDFGRWDEAGNIEFIGRNDDQVKIRGFRIELGEIELRLRVVETVQKAVVIARRAGGTSELIAYVVSAPGATEEHLRARLRKTLPDYMVPAHFVFLSELPLNASGKVDRRALPAPKVVALAEATSDTPWTTDAEKALSAVWAEVLGRAPGDREAHYFNSGGDSIKAIQMAARLRARGLRLTLREVFAKPRFGDMAEALTGEQAVAGEAISEDGEIPLTPIQRWFLGRHTPPYDHFNQTTLLECRERLDPVLVRQAVERLVARHGMLRCRVAQDTAGVWTQRVESGKGAVVWQEAGEAELRAVAEALQASLSLAEGRLVAAGYFRGAKHDRLLLVIHHWAVDGISWRVLVEELEALLAREAAPLPPPVPFHAWALALQAYAESAAVQRQRGYWEAVMAAWPEWLGGEGDVLEPEHTLAFPREFTATLLASANVPYSTQVTELLLAALSQAWSAVAGRSSLGLALEGHGREGSVAAVDVSQTVGWFTSMWPFCLAAQGDWPERIRTVKDALRAVPERGVGYGALRFLAKKPLAATPEPRVSFNYLGVFGDDAGGVFRAVADVSTGEPAAAHLRAAFDLDIVAEVTGGRLQVRFAYHRAVLDAAGRQQLAVAFGEALHSCVAHCASATPQRSLSDISGGVATLSELDRVAGDCAARGMEVEDIMPLTPMQAGMAFHALHEPASAAYSDSVVMRLRGPLEVRRFEQAWLALGAQYPNLRTVFARTESGGLVAVIPRGLSLGFSRGRDDAPFDLAKGPLLRLSLVAVAPDEHEVALRVHHSVLDGWSTGILWRRLEENYLALGAGAPLPRVTASFRDFLRWHQAGDAARELEQWRGLLAGCPMGAAVPTGLPRLGAPAIRTRSTTWELGGERSARLVEAARALGTTESALFQTLWGVFLGKLTRATDVVFGATVSGRSEQVPKVEEIVGLLINTVPVRVQWAADTTFRALAARVRAEAVGSLERTRVALADLQQAVLDRGALVQHTLVFENYPAEESPEKLRPWQIETIAIDDPMHFEFGMIVVPRREGWRCRVIADEARYPAAYLRALQGAWEESIDACLGQPEVPIETWSLARDVRRHRLIVVAATFTAEPMEEALGFWQEALGYAGEVIFAPFNQVQQQLLDPRSELAGNRAGINLLLVRLEDWAGERRTDMQGMEESLELAGDLLVDGLRRLKDTASAALHLVVFCPVSPVVRTEPALARRLEEVEARLVRRIVGIGAPRVQACRSAELVARCAGVEIADARAEALGGVPYSEAFFQRLATEAMRRSDALARAPLKILALDADNTLWRGVLGEDGAAGLTLTPAHRSLQLAAKGLREKGWLLALVTKNNPDDIAAVWRDRADFPLREDDFIALEAGWGAKSESLRALARRLKLGLDAILFLDDSALECAEVRAALPEVLALQVSVEEAALARFVEHCWALDAIAVTEEDRKRSDLYRTEAQREKTRQASGGLRAFVAQLQLEVHFVPIDVGNLARAAQLTQRTNQFNASTRRRTEAELQSLLSSGWQGRVVDVKDRFGSYGLSGCVLWRIAASIMEVDTLLLSCRVLGRGVEHAVMRWLAAEAATAGVTTMRVFFEPTQKNVPAAQFLRSCASRVGEGACWCEIATLATLEVSEAGGGESQEAAPASPVEGTSPGLPAAWSFHQAVSSELATAEGLAQAVASYCARQRQRAVRAEYEAPRDAREARIASLWAEVLGVERVGRRDSFFALGGHSLRAVMMLSRVNRACGVELALEVIFAAPVLAEFAARVAAAAPVAEVGAELIPVPAADHYPVSHAQRRLWLVEQMRASGPSPFHMAASFTLSGELDVSRLEAALRALISRHESLRTGIVAVSDEPRQVVLQEVAFAIEAVADEAAFFAREFDLARPPLLRVGVQLEGDRAARLLLVMHHIVSDGWSISVIAQELSRLYRTGSAQPHSPLPVHYKDFAVWQAARMESGQMRASLGCWKAVLADLPAPLEMPLDRPRPLAKLSRGADTVAILPASEWMAFKRVAEREGSSAFMGAMAILQLVLARQARAERFIVGTPVAGRDRPELEGQIGFYVNLLPILAEVRPAEPLSAHLRRVRETVARALSHAAYPFDRMVDELQLPRDLGRAPLFDVLMVYQGNRDADLAFEGVTLRTEERPAATSQYDLTFEFAEVADGLRLRVEYDVALFDAPRVERLSRQVIEGLRRAVLDTRIAVSALELCPAGEIARIGGFERGSEFGSYRATSIPALVWEAAARFPEKTAIVSEGRVVRYRDLEMRVRSLARKLVAAGVQKQAVVAVAGQRTEDFVVAMLGAMQAGCIYLPLELKHPDTRLRTIVDDAGVRHGLALGTEAEARLRGLGLALVPQDTYEAEAPAEPAADDLAYVIYTSGSTGKPKGVEITHGAFATMIVAQIAAFGIEPEDRCAWWASSAFDASLSEIFLGLVRGATVIVAGEAERSDPDRFLHWLRSEHVTVATLPPAFLRVLGRVPLDPLRVLITAGEAADPVDARHYAQRLVYFNAYGPTETSVCATVQHVTPETRYDANVPIGKPLAVASAYVLDAAGRRAPLGVPGELYIGGQLVGRGYRGSAALTAERFVKDPFSAREGARMYRTGDLVRWREDGSLEFLGRDDGQVKIRGFRIEIGEIEAALRAHPSVRDAAVLAQAWRGELRLVAYVATDAARVQQVREHLAASLPDYMQPSIYVTVERLPMTPNGKLDRAALPVPDLTAVDQGVLSALETPGERALAAGWQACTGAERIGRESDFFALGGDSIKALRLVAFLRARGWLLALKTIFAYPRLEAQAAQLVATDARPAAREVAGDVPLLPIQKWFFEAHRDSPLHHFNQALNYRARERVDADRLQRAVAVLWRQHALLRAAFVCDESGAWRQTVRPASSPAPDVEMLDTRGLDSAAARQREEEWARGLQAGFDLAARPLVRYGWVRGAEADKVLCLTHHLVSDWVSHRILLEDLNLAYEGAELPPPVTEVDEWVRAGQRWAADASLRQPALAGWRAVAEGCAPWGMKEPAGLYGEVVVASRSLDRAATARLQSVVAALPGTTVRDALLAAMVRAERELYGRGALAVALEGHGRDSLADNRLDVSRTVGWFTSLYPCKLSSDTVRGVRESLDALPEGGRGYDFLRTYGPAAEVAADTRMGFNYLGEFAAVGAAAIFEMDGTQPPGAIHPHFERDHPREVVAWIFGGELTLLVADRAGTRDAELAEAWLAQIVAALDRL